MSLNALMGSFRTLADVSKAPFTTPRPNGPTFTDAEIE